MTSIPPEAIEAAERWVNELDFKPRRGVEGQAMRFARALLNAELHLTATIEGERWATERAIKAVAELAALRETVERKQAEHDYTIRQANITSRELMQLRAKVAAALKEADGIIGDCDYELVKTFRSICARHGLTDGAP